YGLVGEALQVELHPALRLVVEGEVLEPGDVDIAVELAIDPLQEVEVEGGVEPRPVVVGTLEDRAVLLEVDPDQHLPLGPEQFGAMAAEAHHRLTLAIDDRRSGHQPNLLA